jgi:hypothetical protein
MSKPRYKPGSRRGAGGQPPKPLHERARHQTTGKLPVWVDYDAASRVQHLQLHAVPGVVTPDEHVAWLIRWVDEHQDVVYGSSDDCNL